MNLKKIGNKEKRLVRCLVAAADAHDELAAAYRKYGWDLSADETEQVARGLRERAKIFSSPTGLCLKDARYGVGNRRTQTKQ